MNYMKTFSPKLASASFQLYLSVYMQSLDRISCFSPSTPFCKNIFTPGYNPQQEKGNYQNAKTKPTNPVGKFTLHKRQLAQSSHYNELVQIAWLHVV